MLSRNKCFVSALFSTVVMLCCGSAVWSKSPPPPLTTAAVGPAVVKTTKTAEPVKAPEPTQVVAETRLAKPQMFEPDAFEDPEVCSTCHSEIYKEWSKSMHAYAWTDQWYQPDFLLAHEQTNGATDLLCGACHAPIAARTGQLPPRRWQQIRQDRPPRYFLRLLPHRDRGQPDVQHGSYL